MKQFIPLDVVYADIEAEKNDPFTGRFKRLIAEYTISDIHTDRECEKETVNEDGRRVVLLGKRCSATFGVKIYKINGASANPLKRYVMFVGLSRQNPIDIKDDENLAEEIAHENAIVDPIMTVHLPKVLTEREVSDMIGPLLDSLPDKLVMTSKQAKAKKEELEKNGYEEWIKASEDNQFWNAVAQMHYLTFGKTVPMQREERHL